MITSNVGKFRSIFSKFELKFYLVMCTIQIDKIVGDSSSSEDNSDEILEVPLHNHTHTRPNLRHSLFKS